jgi:hypothetical protein
VAEIIIITTIIGSITISLSVLLLWVWYNHSQRRLAMTRLREEEADPGIALRHIYTGPPSNAAAAEVHDASEETPYTPTTESRVKPISGHLRSAVSTNLLYLQHYA